MVASAVLGCPLDDLDVLGFLHHADDGFITRGIRTDAADILLRDVVADTAKRHPVLQPAQRILEAFQIFRFDLHEVQCNALRALGSDAGKARELVDDVLQRSFEQLEAHAVQALGQGTHLLLGECLQLLVSVLECTHD